MPKIQCENEGHYWELHIYTFSFYIIQVQRCHLESADMKFCVVQKFANYNVFLPIVAIKS